MPAPFRPDSLDLATLRRLAKNLKKGYPEVFAGTDIPLSQAQELLARALRYPDWHHAVHARPAPQAPAAANPLLVPEDVPRTPIPDDLWSSATLRSLLFAQMHQGLEACLPIMDLLVLLGKTFRQLNEPCIADWLMAEAAWLTNRPDTIAWWRRVAEAIAPHSSKVAMLVRLMARGSDWPRGLRAIVQQCELEQGTAVYRSAHPVELATPDDSPWRLVANRHMVFSALSACLNQGMSMKESFEFLRDDFRENGHEALALTLDPWASHDAQALHGIARQIAPYTLESAVILVAGQAWGSVAQALKAVEAQSALELRRAQGDGDNDLRDPRARRPGR